ncbi:RNA-directed DNA polymerase, eukaryota [Artemisia annua]|uniref:RNA-directed DNA polymerase, eukaryota n=1 Tax=Artemisia annua TaxID=35608 RepID=A0A2U1NWV7_ARTAN|nr:RNA-directed DNA polymerase, eukaryota [Artemisia annua]
MPLFKTQQGALWVKIVKAIHGRQGKLDSNSLPSHSSTWLDIIKCTNKLRVKGQRDVNLKIIFPRLFALELKKDISVYDKVNGGLSHSFRRLPRGGVESSQMDSLISLLPSYLVSCMSDRWVWTLDGLGEFSVASVRSYIEDTLFGASGNPTRWVRLVPIKVNVLVWRLTILRGTTFLLEVWRSLQLCVRFVIPMWNL